MTKQSEPIVTHIVASDQSLTEEITFKEILLGINFWLRYLLSKWKLILLFMLLGGIANYIRVRNRPTLYAASSVFVLQESIDGGNDGAGNVFASMIGFGSDNDERGIFRGDNLLELYRSRFMIKSTLLRKNPDSAGYIVDRYIEIKGYKNKWKQDPALRQLNFFKKGDKKYKRIQDSVMSVFVNDIRDNMLNVSHVGRLSLFNVEVKSVNEDFSMLFNEQIVKNINDFYIQTKTQRSVETIKLLQHQVDSINTALRGAMHHVASSTDAMINVNPARQVLRLPSQTSQVKAEINRAMLNEIVRNLEISKMSLRRETPLIQILDGPVYPLLKLKPSILKAVAIGALAAALLTLLFYSLTLLYKTILNG